MRAKHFNSKVLLGSATPSLESKARALKGVYHLVYLNNRINKQELPKTRIIDLSKGYNLTRDSYMFSKQLIEELQGVLDRKEQAVLLINRRGFSGYITCRSCGHMFMSYRRLNLEAGLPAKSAHVLHGTADALRVRAVRLQPRHPEARTKPYFVAEVGNLAQHGERARPRLVARRVVAL